jgi:hypothetical protein
MNRSLANEGDSTMKPLRLIVLVILAVVALAACGGDDLTEEQIENALRDSFTGNVDPLKEISCEAEQDSIESTNEGTELLPEGATVSFDCRIDGDVATCTGEMTMTVEGADPATQPLGEFKIKIEDGKLCGQAE